MKVIVQVSYAMGKDGESLVAMLRAFKDGKRVDTEVAHFVETMVKRAFREGREFERDNANVTTLESMREEATDDEA